MRSTRTRSRPRLIVRRHGREHPIDNFVFDWRDPNMPCCQPAVDNMTGEVVTLIISPEEQQFCAIERMRNGIFNGGD